MSTELSPYVAGGLSRDSRRAARAISRGEVVRQVRQAGIDVETEIALDKIDAITTATGNGMGSVVRVAQAQRHLETLAPEAAGRLAYLADDHMLAVGDIVHDLRRELRRR